MSSAGQASLAQQRASDPSGSAWVSANAGSGKTHVLVDRLIRLMLAGTAPARILCLTFTKAAAAEMSSRLLDRLSKWTLLPDSELAQQLSGIGLASPDSDVLRRARQLFTSALETPGGLKIQTIHAFCEKLLQLFPVEAGIVPNFTVMDERGASETLLAARRAVLSQAARDSKGELAGAVTEIVRHARADDLDDLLSVLLKERAALATYLNAKTGVGQAVRDLREHFSLAAEKPAFEVNDQDYRRVAEALRTGKATDQQRAELLYKALTTGIKDCEALRSFFLTGKDLPLQRLATNGVIGAHPWLQGFLKIEQERVVEALGLSADFDCIAATAALLTLACAIIDAFEREKRRRGAYDFDDLILRTQLLLAERPEASWVLYKLDGGIEHVLLDEAQDMSPAQWEIVRALTVEFFSGVGVRSQLERTLFAVGDRKQSIFSFQGANPDTFEAMHDYFDERVRSAERKFNDVDFTISYRSTSAVLKAVDLVFAESSPARQGLDGRTSKLLHHEPQRGDGGTVEIWPLIDSEDRGEDQPWHVPVDREPANSARRRLAGKIAATIKSWIGSRMLVSENRAVEPRDILILVQVRNGFFDALIRELRKSEIAVAGADRLKLQENIAVMDLLALARFCLLADDDYSLACLLKSPLLPQPFSEDQIFDLAANRGSHSLWRRLSASVEPHCIATLERLSLWRSKAREASPYEFFAAVLGFRGGDSTVRKSILSRLGSEAKDALDAFLNSALDYERENSSSLQEFLHWFASGEVMIKRDMEQGENEVRIMTVHGAKGLEAPIVILPDTASTPDDRKKSPLLTIGGKLPFWPLPKRYRSPKATECLNAKKDASNYEHRRLLYVAMTRAEDELYICGYGGQKKSPAGCWYNLIIPALQPRMDALGGDAGWRLGAGPFQAPNLPGTSRGRVEIPAWASRVPEPEPDSLPWTKPSNLNGSGLQSTRVQLPSLERGILVHRILQLLPDVQQSKRADFIARHVKKARQEERLGAEITSLIERPDLVSLFGADGLSEIPLVAEIKELRRTVSGRIDRLILGDDEITIVDYKTDHDWAHAPEFVKADYLIQMAAYQAALKDIHPGMAVCCAILWTAAPLFMKLPECLLAQALHQAGVDRP